jgi:uncharacterized integral membrane protein
MLKPKVIIPLVLFILFVIIVLQNSQAVSLRLFFWKVSTSQIILTPVLVVLGFVVGFVVAKVTGKR